MYFTVDMIFRKKHIRCFVESLSISNNRQVVEFEKKDKLNAIVKSYLIKPREDYRPLFGSEVVKIMVPENNRESRAFKVLPKSAYKDLEANFETQFYSLYMNIEATSKFLPGSRKELRMKFLAAFNITDDIMSEDSFRKSFDRFSDKMQAKAMNLINNNNFTALSIYKSVI